MVRFADTKTLIVSEELLLKTSLLNLNGFIEIFIVLVYHRNTKREMLSPPYWI
uniref:Uncharacterized protein n=1 Tax=Lepeophtheirus salmonis TaxID=72036 RepID=A0A0K2TAP9_LEPSM